MAYQLYQFEGCKYDFWQCEHMAQELMAEGVPMSPTKLLAAEDLDLDRQALLDAFANRSNCAFSTRGPRGDLTSTCRVRVKETLRGYKLEPVRDDAGGHADRAMALSFRFTGRIRVTRTNMTWPNLRQRCLPHERRDHIRSRHAAFSFVGEPAAAGEAKCYSFNKTDVTHAS